MNDLSVRLAFLHGLHGARSSVVREELVSDWFGVAIFAAGGFEIARF
jgi:hypothetical protein